jgi:hypothetical protein
LVVLGSYRPVPGEARSIALAFSVERDGEWKKVTLGPGSVRRAASMLDSGEIYAVREESPDEGRTEYYSFLMQSDDAGKSWKTVKGAPPDIAGTRFESPKDGWAWSSRTLYRTDDGGLSWRTVPLEAAEIALTTAAPVLGSGGVLWLAAHTEGRIQGYNSLASVSPRTMRVEWVLRNDTYSLRTMDMAADGSLWFVADSDEYKDLRIIQVESESRVARQIATLPDGMADYMRVSGRSILVGMSGGFEDRFAPFLMHSADGGLVWRRRDLPSPSPEIYCSPDANAVWVVPNNGPVRIEVFD